MTRCIRSMARWSLQGFGAAVGLAAALGLYPLTASTAPVKTIASSALSPIVTPIDHIRSDTVFYRIVASRFNLDFLDDSGMGGPFEFIDRTHILFVGRCGTVHIATVSPAGISLLKTSALPNAGEVFCAADSAPPQILATLPNHGVYGVKNMKLDLARQRLFVSTHVLAEGHCLILKIFEYPFDARFFGIGAPHEVFATTPHIAGFDNTGGCPKIAPLVATQAGGAMAIDGDGAMYFSVGDFGSYDSPQDNASPYGKIFKYANGQVVQFASGSRNAQGLDYDLEHQRLFETEHGPKGGDEINIVAAGDNLGWPISSYGIDYAQSGTKHYKPNPAKWKWGTHDFGKKPAFVYMPAIGITDITTINADSQFKNWRGNVVVSSLRGNSLFRVLIDDERGMYSEPILDLKERVRYLVQGAEGALYAKADPNTFYIIQLDWPAMRRHDAGEDREARLGDEITQCKSCHIPHGVKNGVPNIYSQAPAHLMERLHYYASDPTANPVMGSIARQLNDEDIEAIAQYFSKL